ncbi:unnamed protein product [Nezara viridula]|uniref:Neuropeptide n=1 Tax=Nezara viridula TaxID=85310 RepID=A0A9P0HHY0_NEZVI|nr:unnamed protein product [Nezara viridula]
MSWIRHTLLIKAVGPVGCPLLVAYLAEERPVVVEPGGEAAAMDVVAVLADAVDPVGPDEAAEAADGVPQIPVGIGEPAIQARAALSHPLPASTAHLAALEGVTQTSFL